MCFTPDFPGNFISFEFCSKWQRDNFLFHSWRLSWPVFHRLVQNMVGRVRHSPSEREMTHGSRLLLTCLSFCTQSCVHCRGHQLSIGMVRLCVCVCIWLGFCEPGGSREPQPPYCVLSALIISINGFNIRQFFPANYSWELGVVIYWRSSHSHHDRCSLLMEQLSVV